MINARTKSRLGLSAHSGRKCSVCGKLIKGPNYFFCAQCWKQMNRLEDRLDNEYIFETSESTLLSRKRKSRQPES